MAKKPPSIILYRIGDGRRIYSNHVEVNISKVDINFKFGDVLPPENEETIIEIEEKGKIKAPILAEIVIPMEVAKDLRRILNEKIKDK